MSAVGVPRALGSPVTPIWQKRKLGHRSQPLASCCAPTPWPHHLAPPQPQAPPQPAWGAAARGLTQGQASVSGPRVFPKQRTPPNATLTPLSLVPVGAAAPGCHAPSPSQRRRARAAGGGCCAGPPAPGACTGDPLRVPPLLYTQRNSTCAQGPQGGSRVTRAVTARRGLRHHPREPAALSTHTPSPAPLSPRPRPPRRPHGSPPPHRPWLRPSPPHTRARAGRRCWPSGPA